MAYKRKRVVRGDKMRIKKQFVPGVGYKMMKTYKRRSGVSAYLDKRIRRLESTIETKESTWSTNDNVSLPHNNVVMLTGSSSLPLNPFRFANNGTGDPMSDNTGSRIGDRITVKGLKIKFFIENALQRSRVYYRVMLLKGPRGATFDRTNIFKGAASNKMIDMIDTEKFTIVWQKVFTINVASAAASTVDLNGVTQGGPYQGIGTKLISAWIPGRRFARGGNIQYENGSVDTVKFYDYRFCVLAYDWYGTPQDVNNVGKVNDLMMKLYFKDA